MEKEQKKILENLDLLVSLTVNFPGVLSQAVAASLINPTEKEIISTHYHSIEEKLKTVYLVSSGKSTDAFDRLIDLLQKTGNNKAASVLLNSGNAESQEKMDESHKEMILSNLEKLSSHSQNLPMVFSYASGMELITGKEREIIMDKFLGTDERFSEFYKLTTKKGPAAYSKLIQVLKMTQNNWALDVLHYEDSEEKDFIDH